MWHVQTEGSMMPNWGCSILALCAGGYMAWLAISSWRSGELVKFQPNLMTQIAVDLTAETSDDARWLKYADKDRAPIRFWLGVWIRILLAIAGLLMAAYFLVISLS
jgi:hypothetical protein